MGFFLASWIQMVVYGIILIYGFKSVLLLQDNTNTESEIWCTVTECYDLVQDVQEYHPDHFWYSWQ